MPSKYPYTKRELTQRLKFVRGGWWNDSILVFMDREVYARTVTVEGDRVRVQGYERQPNTSDYNELTVDEVIDPRDVTRVVH